MTENQFNKEWNHWRCFPNPRSGEYLLAPFGPGVYELRNRATKELVLFGSGKCVAYRMSSLLPKPYGCGTRNNAPKREYVDKHIEEIDYRTKACSNEEDAKEEERLLRKNKEAYLFPT